MTRRITVFSPAKVNLFLSVAGKRADGFHDLVSLAAPLDFGDEIELAVDDEPGGVVLDCDDPGLPTGSENLAVRAAEAFRSETRSSSRTTIQLKKRIPIGAGLGGGSSNAVAVLRGLNRLHESPLTDAKLKSLAAAIGSDCPLFLAGGPCVMRGRGEIVELLEPEHRKRLTGQPLLIFKPGFSISTRWAYEKLAESRSEAPSVQSAMDQLDRWKRGGGGIEQLMFNSFESIVFKKFLSLPVIVERLMAEPSVTAGLLSGSGSACFLLLDPHQPSAVLETIITEALGETAFCHRASLIEMAVDRH